MPQADSVVIEQFHAFDPLKEDTLMTFQVVLVATDGLIVGSDRRVMVRSGESARGEWQYMAGSKFVMRADESIICAAAGGPQARSIAQAIVDQGDPTQAQVAWAESLRKIAESVMGNSVGDEVIVIRKELPDAFLINRQNQIASTCKIEDRICTGVTATARFLTQHFWQSASVRELKNLALLVLAYAARERPTEVGEGFDLMVLREGDITWEQYAPDDESIRRVKAGFDASVRSWLTSVGV